MDLKSGKQPCAKKGCARNVMKDGSGLCYAHNPAMREKRKEGFVKRGIPNVAKRPTPDQSCSVEGCCEWPMRDGSGLCYAHNPTQREKHQEWSRKMAEIRSEMPPERKCRIESCQVYNMKDGSGFCRFHNPAYSENRKSWLRRGTAKRKNIPSRRRCGFKKCKSYSMLDGSGLCFHHHPEEREKRRKRMLGNKYRLGQPSPWLGLANIQEARGLIFYSLETNQPRLTLRGLTKIISLYRQGKMTMPKPLSEETRKALAEEYINGFLGENSPKQSQPPSPVDLRAAYIHGFLGDEDFQGDENTEEVAE